MHPVMHAHMHASVRAYVPAYIHLSTAYLTCITYVHTYMHYASIHMQVHMYAVKDKRTQRVGSKDVAAVLKRMPASCGSLQLLLISGSMQLHYAPKAPNLWLGCTRRHYLEKVSNFGTLGHDFGNMLCIYALAPLGPLETTRQSLEPWKGLGKRVAVTGTHLQATETASVRSR